MNKLTKLLVLSSIASATLFANDNLVIDFEKKRLSQNPNVKASNIEIFYKKEELLNRSKDKNNCSS